MEYKTNRDYDSSMVSKEARENARQYQSKNTQLRKKREEDFFSKSFDYRDVVFAPEGFEAVMFGIYIILLPYLAGLAFLYLFIAEGNFEYFVEFDLASFLVIWSIGYEVIAGLIMVGVLLNAVRYYTKKGQESSRNNRRDSF